MQVWLEFSDEYNRSKDSTVKTEGITWCASLGSVWLQNHVLPSPAQFYITGEYIPESCISWLLH
jgi:hypothetical protein